MFLRWRLIAVLVLAWFVGNSHLYAQATAPSSAAERIKLSEILIPLAQSPSLEELASSEKEARVIIDRLNAGSSFEQEAREHSKGPTAAQGGNVGYFARGVLPSIIEQQVFNLKIGAIAGPIRTKQGLVIMKVTDRSETPPKNSQGMVDVLSDTAGVDFGPYLSSAVNTIRKNWYQVIPDEAKSPTMKKGALAVIFSIRKNGAIEGMKIAAPSGDSELDRAAWQAIRASNPLPPLPSEFPKDSLTIRLRFYYNPNRPTPESLRKDASPAH